MRLPALAALAAVPLLAGCLATPGAGGAPTASAQAGFSSGVVTAGGGAQDLRALPGEVAPLPIPLRGGDVRTLGSGARVIVPAYGVTVITAQNVRAVSQGALGGGFGGGSTRSASVRTVLAGLSPAIYQQIADEAHADLLQRLAAAGIAVASAQEAAQAAAAAPRVPGNALDGSAGSTILGGSSSTWRTVGAGAAPLIAGLSGEEAGGGLGGLAVIGGNSAAQALATSSGGLVVMPLLRLDYVSLSSSGRSLLSGRANAEATARFSVVAGSKATVAVRRQGMGAADIAALSVPEAVGTDEPFATMGASSGGSVGALVGFGTRTDTQVVANEARWVALARAAYRGFNAAIVQQIAGARGV